MKLGMVFLMLIHILPNAYWHPWTTFCIVCAKFWLSSDCDMRAHTGRWRARALDPRPTYVPGRDADQYCYRLHRAYDQGWARTPFWSEKGVVGSKSLQS